MNIQYQIMRQKDWKECASLFVNCFQQEPWNENWTIQQAYNRLQEIMSSPYAFGYIVLNQNKIIGMMCGRIMTFMNFNELWIDDFCITNEYQGQGLGSQFLNQIKIILEEKAVSRITLNTTRGFLSDRFYMKNGFIESDNMVTMHCDL